MEKPERERYTLWLTKEAADKLRVLSIKNRRSVAWIIREYCAECVKDVKINEKIGLKIQ
jgi:hypothetical protein